MLIIIVFGFVLPYVLISLRFFTLFNFLLLVFFFLGTFCSSFLLIRLLICLGYFFIYFLMKSENKTYWYNLFISKFLNKKIGYFVIKRIFGITLLNKNNHNFWCKIYFYVNLIYIIYKTVYALVSGFL